MAVFLSQLSGFYNRIIPVFKAVLLFEDHEHEILTLWPCSLHTEISTDPESVGDIMYYR